MDRGKASFLGRAPVLARLPAELLAHVVERTEPVRVRRRRPLWSAGDPAEHLYFVRSGVVGIRLDVDGSHRLILAFHGKGELIGEVGAVASVESRRPALRHTEAVAHEEVVAYALGVEDLRVLMHREPGLSTALAALQGERRRRIEQRLAVLPHRPVPIRVATVLLDLAVDFGVRDSRGIIINLRLTHRELADLVGSTRETVSAVISDLRRSGVLHSEGKRIVLLQLDTLARRVEGGV